MDQHPAQLIDLPEQQIVRPTICTPKIIFLSLLAAFFVGQNIYQNAMKPIDPSTTPPPQVDQQANFAFTLDRLFWYSVISIIGFIIFYFLKQSNIRYEEQKALQQLRIAQAKAEENRKIVAQKEKKMFEKLEQEEKEEEERIKQMQILNNNLQNKT